MSHALRVALAALPLAVCACSTAEDKPDLEETGLVSFNGLAPEALLQSGNALRALAGARLGGVTTELANSTDGQALLTDLVRCSLPTGQTASFQRNGGPALVLPGLIGLAPSWRNGAIGETDQRFVTACLMAHVNGREVPFPISVRSARRSADLLEKLTFPAEEMAVYGNLFAPASERELFACFGAAVAQTLGSRGGVSDSLGVPNYLDIRFCSIRDGEEGCGFNLVGACLRFRNGPTQACESQSGNIFNRCHERPIQQASTPSHNETVSVYLQPGDLALLLSEYTADVCDALGICIDLDLGGIL